MSASAADGLLTPAVEEALAAAKQRRMRVVELAQKFDEAADMASRESSSWDIVRQRTAKGVDLCDMLSKGAKALAQSVPPESRGSLSQILGGIARLKTQWEERAAPLERAIADAKAAAAEFTAATAALDGDLAAVRAAAVRDIAAAREEVAAECDAVIQRAESAVSQAREEANAACAAADAHLESSRSRLERRAGEKLQTRILEMEAEVKATMEAERAELAQKEAALLKAVSEKEEMALQLAAAKEAMAFEKAAAKEREALAAAEAIGKQALQAATDKEAEARKLVNQERQVTLKVRDHQKFLDEQVNHARLIQSLHAGSSQVDLQNRLSEAIQDLREKDKQLVEKDKEIKTLAARRGSGTVPSVFASSGAASGSIPDTDYELVGATSLGGIVEVRDAETDAAPTSSTFQWFRVVPTGLRQQLLGATSCQYAPEPKDVGCVLGCSVIKEGTSVDVLAGAALDPAHGQSQYQKGLLRTGSATFTVLLTSSNGVKCDPPEQHVLEATPEKVKLKKGMKSRSKEAYSPGMQICGTRATSDAESMFFLLAPGNAVVLKFESSRERNVCIEVMRKWAADKGVTIGGPEDLQLKIM